VAAQARGGQRGGAWHIDGPSDDEKPNMSTFSSTVTSSDVCEVYAHFFDEAVETFFKMIKATTLIKPMSSRKSEDKFFEECLNQARTYTFLPKNASHGASTAGDDENEDVDSDVEEDDGDRAYAAILAEGLTCIIESTETETEAKKDVSKRRKFVYAKGAWIRPQYAVKKIVADIDKEYANSGKVHSCLVDSHLENSASLDDTARRIRKMGPIVVGHAPM